MHTLLIQSTSLGEIGRIADLLSEYNVDYTLTPNGAAPVKHKRAGSKWHEDGEYKTVKIGDVLTCETTKNYKPNTGDVTYEVFEDQNYVVLAWRGNSRGVVFRLRNQAGKVVYGPGSAFKELAR